VSTGKLDFEGFQLDPANARLCRGGEPVALAPKPFDVLCHLVERPGELVTKDQLLDALWPNLNVTESSLSYAINAVRIALGDNAQAPRFIETVTRRGYRFIAPVTVVSASSAERPPEERASLPSASRPHWWVGRATPLEALESLLQQSLLGNRQVVFITGEAGIGKTTFLEMAMGRMSRRGIGALWGRCIEHFGTDEAFLPLIEALQERCGGADGPLFLKTLRDHAPTWLAQMPGFLDAKDRSAFQNEVFGATRERMLREFCELLEVLSSDRHWVIILEDLHWSDFATLDVLSRFARRDRKASVLVLATYRPIDVMIESHPVRALHQDLQIHGRCTELGLDRLSRAEVEQYLALRFGKAEMVRTLAGEVFRRTQGQPLFVVSLVDYFVAQRAIVDVEGHWRLAAEEAICQKDMPRDLRDMITAQIDRLSTDEKQLLEAASAAGDEFSAALVAGAMNRNTLEVEQAFEGLARKGHVLTAAGVTEWPDGTVAGCYSFQHALYQEVLYRRLAPGQRVQTHRRLGERLEEGYEARAMEIASALALHFEEGRDFARAVRYLGLAAENSARRFGNREAATYLTRALGLVSRLPAEEQLTTPIKLLQQRARAKRAAGELDGPIEDLTTAVSCAEAAGDLHAEVKALVHLSEFCIFVDRRRCLEVADRALARSQALDAGSVKIRAQDYSAVTNLGLRGWRHEDADYCRQALKTMGNARDPGILIRRYAMESSFQLLSSNYRESSVAAKFCQKLAQQRGDPYSFAFFNVFETLSLLHQGAWREMRQSLAAALAVTERDATRLSGPSRLMVAWLHAEALDFEGVAKRCAAALDQTLETPMTNLLGRILLAKACLGLHDCPRAFALLDEVTNRMEVDDFLMESIFYPYYVLCLCEYWLAVRDLPRAHEQATRLYHIAAVPPERTYLALAHRLLAKIALAEGELENAKTQLSRAIAIVEQAELPLAAWRVYATAARLHERLGETTKTADFQHRSEKVIHILAANFDQDDPLRSSLLAGFAAESSHS
jgi:DNA-binding winged helix-turn-helix (wHTH) protein